MDVLTDKEKKELEKLRKQKEKQLKRQNEYIKNNYDRFGFALPKGQKAIIENHYKSRGYKNITDYIKALIETDLKTPAE